MRRCGKPYPSELDARVSKRGQVPGARFEQCWVPGCAAWHIKPPLAGGQDAPAEPQRSKPLRPVSRRRAAENQQRSRLIDQMYPGRVAFCVVPGDPHLADDIHEALPRARGGSIVDVSIWRPLCRRHHHQVTFAPESELGWAYDLGLLIHSWDSRGGEAA
jgi:hypothetical protein